MQCFHSHMCQYVDTLPACFIYSVDSWILCSRLRVRLHPSERRFLQGRINHLPHFKTRRLLCTRWSMCPRWVFSDLAFARSFIDIIGLRLPACSSSQGYTLTGTSQANYKCVNYSTNASHCGTASASVSCATSYNGIGSARCLSGRCALSECFCFSFYEHYFDRFCRRELRLPCRLLPILVSILRISIPL